MREKGASDNDLLARLAADDRLGLTEADLRSLVASPLEFTGAAASQVRSVVERIDALTAAHPAAAAYVPGAIL
jgi:adenylosuccinate lyase